MTPADRLHLADDALAACSEAPDTADLRPDLRARALAYAAAWHEVNGATLRAEIETAAVQEARGLAVSLATVTKERDDLHAAYKLLGDSHGRVTARAEQAEQAEQARAEAIDKLTATFAEGRAAGHEAERKAWQDATDRQTPEAAKEWLDRAERVASDIARQRDQARARAEAAEEAKNIATVAMGLAETRATEATARAEQAEREVARLKAEATRPGPATDGELSALWAKTGGSVTTSNRAVYALGLAHGRAEATRPAPTLTPSAQARIEATREAHRPATRHIDTAAGSLRVLVYMPQGGSPLTFGELSDADRMAIATGFAPAPTPDASDEQVAEALWNELPGGANLRLSFREQATYHRIAITAVVAAAIRPCLDALRAELTAANEAVNYHEKARDEAVADRDMARAEVARLTEARATVPAFDPCLSGCHPRRS